MGAYTLTLDQVGRAELALVGGKAAGLGELIRAGLPVPPGFVITTTAFPGAAGSDVSAEVAQAVFTAYERLAAPVVAVRSSATAEDLADASFAGQYDTVLDVAGKDKLLEAVRRCWESTWSERAADYRLRRGRTGEPAMAVVVQEMIQAVWAGVAFTADPVSGRRDRMVVEAVRGTGERLVSGAASGHSHVVDARTGRLLGDVTPVPRDVLDEVVALLLRLDDGPWDVEWVYDGSRVLLVQSRPMTALPPDPAVSPPEPYPAASGGAKAAASGGKDRAHRPAPLAKLSLLAAEHAPLPPYPMDCSIFLRPAVSAILTAFRSAGLSTPEPDRALAGLADAAIRIELEGVRPAPRMIYRLPVVLPRILRLVLAARPAAWLEKCRATLVPLAERIDADDHRSLSDEELVARMTELRVAAGRLFPGRFACFPRGKLSDRLLRLVLRTRLGAARAAEVHAGLLTAVPSITWAANTELTRLAQQVRETPDLAAAYASATPREVPLALLRSRAGLRHLADVKSYLSDYGYWKTSTPSVGLPPLRETPWAVHSQLKNLAEAPAREQAPGGERLERALAAIAGPGLRARLARRLAATSREFVAFREDSHYHLFTIFAVARGLVLELGRRLTVRGVLERAEDIVYLELHEALELPAAEVTRLVAERTAARAAAMPAYLAIPSTLAPYGNSAGAVRGTPASAGLVTGSVRLIREEAEFGKLSSGDVLVCPFTNPSWTPLFALASAVVVDAGGAASHSAIVAREYGIPAVMGTGDGTRRLRDGQWVEVDGAAGTVHVLSGPSPARPAATP